MFEETSLVDQVLQEQRWYLCSHLEPLKLLPYLKSKGIIDVSDAEIIQSEAVTERRVDYLIDVLIKSRKDAFKQFLKALKRNRTQSFIAVKLVENYLKLENKARESTPPMPPPYSPQSTERSGLLSPSHSQLSTTSSSFKHHYSRTVSCFRTQDFVERDVGFSSDHGKNRDVYSTISTEDQQTKLSFYQEGAGQRNLRSASNRFSAKTSRTPIEHSEQAPSDHKSCLKSLGGSFETSLTDC